MELNVVSPMPMDDFIEEVLGRFVDLFRQGFGQYPGPLIEAVVQGICRGEITVSPEGARRPPLNRVMAMLSMAWGQTELAFWYFPPNRPF